MLIAAIVPGIALQYFATAPMRGLSRIGMIRGFFTFRAIDVWLIRAGIKEEMQAHERSMGPAVHRVMNDLERVRPVIGSGRA